MSVRGERVVYREREREVDYDEPRRSFTTVKRYQVPDRDSRSTVHDNDDVKEEKIIIKRSEGTGRSGRSEVDFRGSDRISDHRSRDGRQRDDVDVRITERVIERDNDRLDLPYRSHHDHRDDRAARSDLRVTEREFSRAPSPPVQERTREYRFEREREYSPARTARDDRPYDLERYSKSTEYFAQPQPIIIRERAQQQAPIIITEERREPQQIVIRRDEPHYEIIERDEVRENMQLARREEPALTTRSVVSQKPQDEDYYFERRIREVARDPRRRREDDIKPSDSASQYSSDESYEYVRRERYIDDERDRSPHHRRHLAEGALAGAGAAAILRSHRKSQGRESAHGTRDVLGGAALGAVGAEVISRARSRRGTSRRRSFVHDDDDSRSRDHHRRHRSRSKSRERSKSRARQLGAVAAVAAVGALAGYALNNRGKNKETLVVQDGRHHRSRSRRHRRGSSSSSEGRLRRSESKHLDPEHRNRRIAQVGLATAATAAVVDRMRSKSRGGRERSKSRLRTAAPIVGAGLSGAALAGLYERNKAGKEAKREAAIEDELARGRKHRSRSRSRSVPPHDRDDSRRPDRNDMIAYGADPIYADDGRGRGHYSDEEAGTYHRRYGSADSSPDTRKRSRSRGRGLAEAGLAAAGAAAVAHEVGRSRERARQDRERRHDDYDDHYSDDYGHGGYITPPANDHYPPRAGDYPHTNYFPPPPTDDHLAREGVPATATPTHQDASNAYPPYNPADYPPATTGASRPNDTFVGDNRFADPAAEAAAARELQEEREMQRERDERAGRAPRNDPGNVSTIVTGDRAAPEVTENRAGTSYDVAQSSQSIPTATHLHNSTAEDISGLPRPTDGVNARRDPRDGSVTPRARSTSRVRFDLDSNVAHPAEDASRRRRARSSSDETRDDDHERDRRRRRHRDRRGRPSSTLMNDTHERSLSSASDETVDLPARFDEHGNRKPDRPAADSLSSRLSELFSSSTTTGGSRYTDSRTSGGSGGGGGGFGSILRDLAGELLRPDRAEDVNSGRRSGRRSGV